MPKLLNFVTFKDFVNIFLRFRGFEVHFLIKIFFYEKVFKKKCVHKMCKSLPAKQFFKNADEENYEIIKRALVVLAY